LENKLIRIGTRGSKLALWQAHFTQAQLKEIGIESELKIIETKGDKIQHLSFDKIEGKGFFTKEIEDSLLRGDVDMAVHSMKDMPTESPEGLCITAVSHRANPSDCLVVRKEKANTDKPLQLPDNAIVGTSSARRKAQLLHFRPDLELTDIRGNVPTRLRKLQEGNFDAIMLASAGLERLEIDLSEFIAIKLHPREFIPAPAQGVLAFQTCVDDIETRRILKKIHHSDVAATTNVERKILQLMEGGCHMPLGAYCMRDAASNYHVWAAMADEWNSPVKKVHHSSSTKMGLAELIVEQLREKKTHI